MNPYAWTQRVGAFSGLPQLIEELGADPVALFAQAGLSGDAFRDPDAVLPYAAIGAVLQEAAARTNCAHLGLLAGRMWRLENMGPTSELVLNSRTVGDALRTHVSHQ